MRNLTLAVTACLFVACHGTAPAAIADRDIDYIVSRNEATRELMGSLKYDVAQGGYVYRAVKTSDLAPFNTLRGKTCVSRRQGTVLVQGDQRAYEFDTLVSGLDGMQDLQTRTFAVRNNRYFALSNGALADGGFVSYGDVHLYPHSVLVEGRPASAREENVSTADVLDYAFLSDRLGMTLRQEIEWFLSPEMGGSATLETLKTLDGTVREYRIHLQDAFASADTPAAVSYSIDPTAGFLIKRKETYNTAGHLVAQRRLEHMPIGETGLYFPSEVIEVTFDLEDGPEGVLPTPRTETRTVVRDVELLLASETSNAFGLTAFGLDGEEEVVVVGQGRDGGLVSMSAADAERVVNPSADRRSSTPNSNRNRSTNSGAPTPSISGGFLSMVWNSFGTAGSYLFGSLR
jgi:hypothetical protein